MIYLKLFLSFLQVGVFSIGGGYAAIPIIQSQVVDSNHWLSMGEFTNLVTIAEMTPGPVSINSATGSAAQQAETQYLHSIMYLLILAIMVYFFAL